MLSNYVQNIFPGGAKNFLGGASSFGVASVKGLNNIDPCLHEWSPFTFKNQYIYIGLLISAYDDRKHGAAAWSSSS